MYKSIIKSNRIFEKFELLSFLLCTCIVIFIYELFGVNISLIAMTTLMVTITIVLCSFIRHHVYWQNKSLLAILSIYYKSISYITIIFTIYGLSGTNIITAFAIFSMLLYIVLAYFNEKKYYQMLNAFLYLQLITLTRIVI
jgi:hypothetical protein